jgi:hypothetical protein
MSEARHRSGIPDDAWKQLTGNARYHISARIREVATPDEVARAGLSPLTARERVTADRDARTAAYESELLVVLRDLVDAVVDFVPPNPEPLLGDDHPLVLAINRARAHLTSGTST